ncbi:NAD-dependent epimerase/dehydratase family protein [Vibrio hannami]|uniref:NAD-dependent epimerase/dehydratase family protein n=1 Tax=Vibrio hannami TaxID=2717094 RepID=UPI003EC13FEE
MTKIAVIGAGWLGEPLARALNAKNHSCVVTRRTQEGLNSIEGLSGFVANLSDTDAENNLTAHLTKHNIHTVIGSFPPGFRKGNGAEYAQWWQRLVKASLAASVKKIVMISSTTVYPSGKGVMTEELSNFINAKKDPQFSDKARLMLQAEQSVIDSGLSFAIVRLSGLFGPNRNPARFISKLKAISRSAPANMLHLDDAIAATVFAVEAIENETVNATTPETVSKADFYTRAAELAGLSSELPEIMDVSDKRISSEKLTKLGYQFKYQHVYDALEAQ